MLRFRRPLAPGYEESHHDYVTTRHTHRKQTTLRLYWL